MVQELDSDDGILHSDNRAMVNPNGTTLTVRADNKRIIRGGILGGNFFDRPTPMVAWDLLGKVLVHFTRRGYLAGKIVETEAYLGGDDPACHAAAGKTERNKVFYRDSPHGTVYVFISFGLHYCVNILTSGERPAGCVLLRSIEPMAGIRRMKINRQTNDLKQLTTGPGRLAEAFGITTNLNGTSIVEGPLQVIDCDLGVSVPTVDVRVGVTKDRDYPLRYFLSNSEYVSRRGSRFFSNGN